MNIERMNIERINIYSIEYILTYIINYADYYNSMISSETPFSHSESHSFEKDVTIT